LKTLSKRTLLIIAFAEIAAFLVLFFLNLFPQSPNPSKLPAERINNEQIQNDFKPPIEYNVFGLPLRIKIPAIGVDANIEHVGLTLQGAVDAPKGPSNGGWFDLGPRPGENGNAIIVGHYGWKNNMRAVFDDLHKLEKGDKIYVEDENGEIIIFAVREIRSFDPKADASDVFISNDDRPHLNLITCEGVWNKDDKSYSKRLVVFADKK
jgi:LPXTG-site transpeptidase (sortase) family protein